MYPMDNRSGLVQLIAWCRTVSWTPDFCSSFVLAVLYTLVCNIGMHCNEIQLYVVKLYHLAITRHDIHSKNKSLQWRHNGHDSVSNHQPHDCFLNRLFWRRSKKTSKLRVSGLCAGNSSGTGEFPAQMASNAENASIWWRHHGCMTSFLTPSWHWVIGTCQLLWA